MSNYKGNNEVCPGCRLRYKDFKTGFSYKDIFDMYWRCTDDPAFWVAKRRGTILGKWFEIKQTMWTDHLVDCVVPF